MYTFRKHNVYTKVPIDERYRVTGTAPRDHIWIDINNGDEGQPEYRSRLVAKQTNRSKNEIFFAATPPLEAKKCVVQLGSQQDSEEPVRVQEHPSQTPIHRRQTGVRLRRRRGAHIRQTP